MTENNIARPAILVDLKKYRIRIHKNTLHSIGDPDNVLLLVNPEELTLAILRCNHSDARAHHISRTFLPNTNSIELYSRSLVESLREVCTDWQGSRSYRLYGEIIPSEGMALFQMAASDIIRGDKI